MTEEIKLRLQKIVLTLLDTLGSKKFYYALSSSLGAWAAGAPIEVVIAPWGILIGAQGIADHGKGKNQ